MLEIRKNGCGVCKCEFGCVGLRSESFDSVNWKWGFMHTDTQTNTPKPNFIRVLKTASRSEGIIYKVRNCDLVRFIRGLSLIKMGFGTEFNFAPLFNSSTLQLNKAMLALKNIEKVYRTDTIETLALSNINLEVKPGEFLSIMGPSGCGKSTLLNIMGLLDAPSGGSIVIDEEKVEGLNDQKLSQLRNRKIGFIFQSYHLINDLSVVDNVELPLLYRQISASERRKLATEALAKVGLSNRLKHYPTQLSGGQKQRVAIARAIVGRPSLILADEPTGNLDSVMGNEVMEILETLNREDKTTIIMVTHDENMAQRTHRLVRLFDGAQVS